MGEIGDLLLYSAERAATYLELQRERQRVGPDPRAASLLKQLAEQLPDQPTDPQATIALLSTAGGAATVSSAGPRYFGFVTGGALPVTVAASCLAGAWDQNAGLYVMSPVAAILEEIALGWVADLLGMPPGTGGGLVTGATMANFAGLAAARHALLAREGWDVERQGLFAAPPLQIVVGDDAHASLMKALAMLGLGRERVTRVAVDDQGRMRADRLPALARRTILCIQAGNVNSGAFDPAGPLCDAAHAVDAWVHVDGAFGLWAAVCPGRAGMARPFSAADSWALDAHKWLNVPYDSGLVFVRNGEHLRAAMSINAPYLQETAVREPSNFTPEMSRRARGIELWAALRSLGRSGLADIIERTCTLATRFAKGLRAAGVEVLNDVVLNQVLVSFGSDQNTRSVIDGVQADGTCWCGGSYWRGRAAMRISVSSWATTAEDVDRSLAAIVRVAEQQRTHREG